MQRDVLGKKKNWLGLRGSPQFSSPPVIIYHPVHECERWGTVPDCAHPTRVFPFIPSHPSGRELKGAVGGVPHRARIGRALFHRARSASTRDGPAPLSALVFLSPPIWPVVT